MGDAEEEPPQSLMETMKAREVSDKADAQRDNYTVIREIGKGTFGVAYLVRHKVEKKLYVLKKIRLARQSERQREASLREMRLLASLDHPNVLRYKEAWLEKGCVVCIVTSYCDGGDLMSLLQRSRGRYFREEILHEWFVQAALALTHIHKHRVLHRDVKSGNILLHNGMLQLADFGLAKQLTNGEKYSKTQVGTPNYMCPELLQEKPYNHKSDVWSLGCVMYELTALRPAFQAFNINGLINKIVKGSLAPMPSDYSPEWRTLVRAMLHKNPNERPELKELLKADFLKDTVRMVKERIKQELRDNPRDMEASQPPNITPQDLKKILQQRQEKDFARVDRDARDRGGGGARGQRGVSGRVGAGGGRFGANGVNNPLRQPSARVGGDGGGGAHRARAARGGAEEHTPLVRRVGVGLGKLDPLGAVAPGMTGTAASDTSSKSNSSGAARGAQPRGGVGGGGGGGGQRYPGRGGVHAPLPRLSNKGLEKLTPGGLATAAGGGGGGGGGATGRLPPMSENTTTSGVGRPLPPPLTPLDIAAAHASVEAELEASLQRRHRATFRAGRAGPSGGGVPVGHMSPRHSLGPGGGGGHTTPSIRRTGALHASGRGPRGGIGDTTDLGVTIRKMEARVRSARRDLGLGPGALNNVEDGTEGDEEGIGGGGSGMSGSMRGAGRRPSGLGPGVRGGDGVARLPQI